MTKPYVYSGFSEKTSAKFSRLFTKLQKEASPEIPIPKFRFEAIQRIVGKKRNIVGSGYYAITFEYGATQVIKTNIAAMDIEDDAQPDWLQWCSQNQNLDWVPRIDYLHIDWKRNEYLAIMEKLNPVNSVMQKNCTKPLLDYEIHGYCNTICEYITATNKESLLEITMEAFKQRTKLKACYGVDLPSYEAFFSDGVGDSIRKELKRMGKQYYIDLHSDNFMIRNSGKNQAIVITDPINNY